MKAFLISLALASTATIAAATSCTSDVALPWSAVTGGGGSDTCNGDEVCEGLVAEGQCNSLSLIDDSDTTCAQKLKMLKRAINLDCTTSETCVAFLDNSLLCLDQSNGDYHDDVGGNGNAISGVYTAPDGKVQTVTGVSADPTTTATATGDDASSTASAARTSTTEAASGTTSARATTGSVASSQSSAVSQQSSAASQQSSAASQSASAAQQTGAALHQVVGSLEMLAIAAVPMVVAAL